MIFQVEIFTVDNFRPIYMYGVYGAILTIIKTSLEICINKFNSVPLHRLTAYLYVDEAEIKLKLTNI